MEDSNYTTTTTTNSIASTPLSSASKHISFKPDSPHPSRVHKKLKHRNFNHLFSSTLFVYTRKPKLQSSLKKRCRNFNQPEHSPAPLPDLSTTVIKTSTCSSNCIFEPASKLQIICRREATEHLRSLGPQNALDGGLQWGGGFSR